MADVEKILQKNNIKPVTIEESQIDPKESRHNFIIKTESTNFHLSFPLNRKTPVKYKTVNQKINAEINAFNKIRENTDLRTPEIIDYSDEYILIQEMDGKQTIKAFKNSDSKKQEDIAEEHGLSLAKIHSITESELGYYGDSNLERSFSSWQSFVQELVDNIEAEASSDLERKAVSYLKNNIEILDLNFQPVLVYGDFQPWNTISKKGETLGIIDGESAFAGHKEYDLAQAAVAWSDKFNVTDSFIRGYKQKGNLEPGWKDRHFYYKILIFTSSIIDARAIEWNDLVEEFEERLSKALN